MADLGGSVDFDVNEKEDRRGGGGGRDRKQRGKGSDPVPDMKQWDRMAREMKRQEVGKEKVYASTSVV